MNEVLYDTLISLNSVFFFESVKCLCIGAPPKDPAQKRFVVFLGFLRNKRNKRVPKSNHNNIHNRAMHANKHKTYLCAHIQWQGPEVHTHPESVTEFGPRGGGIGARAATRLHKQRLPQTTHVNTTNGKHIHNTTGV